MDRDSIKVAKLVNGDTIISSVELITGYVLLTKPLQLVMLPTARGGLRQVLTPWLEASDAVEYTIPDNHIITMSSARSEVIEMYESFFNSDKFDSVEQKENALEEAMKGLLDLLDTSDTIH